MRRNTPFKHAPLPPNFKTDPPPRRAIAFEFFLTPELRKEPESVYFRLLPLLICSHMALKIAVIGITRLAYAAEINFTTCDLCLRNPNAIALRRQQRHLGIESIML
jgi:hypothetical protein